MYIYQYKYINVYFLLLPIIFVLDTRYIIICNNLCMEHNTYIDSKNSNCCVFVTLMLPCLEGSYAKAASHNFVVFESLLLSQI